jgi:lysophospholipase L1-like esterase
MAYGDSITWGKDRPAVPFPSFFTEPPPETSYPSVLTNLLKSRFVDQNIAIPNEGWPGEVVAVGKVRLPGALVESQPEAMLLLHGANDLNTDTANAALVTYIGSALDAMIRDAKGRVPGLKVMLATFPPQFHPTAAEKGTDGRDNGRGADWVPAMNARITSVASSQGAVLVDFYTPMSANVKKYIGNDGLHPTVEGFALMADIMDQAIRQNFEAKSTAVRSSATAR